jgi:TusA-related sulfurtransferase
VLSSVDARGLDCPLPLVMAKVALEAIAPGDALLVLTTDPEAELDLAAWADEAGHVLSVQPAEGWSEFVLRRGR